MRPLGDKSTIEPLRPTLCASSCAVGRGRLKRSCCIPRRLTGEHLPTVNALRIITKQLRSFPPREYGAATTYFGGPLGPAATGPGRGGGGGRGGGHQQHMAGARPRSPKSSRHLFPTCSQCGRLSQTDEH